MPRYFAFRGEKTLLLEPRRSPWQQRQHALVWGTLLTLPVALALVPVLIFLLLSPRFAHAQAVGFVLLAFITVSESVGVAKLARCLRGEFTILSALAFGALLLLFFMLMYTGIFLASFFFH